MSIPSYVLCGGRSRRMGRHKAILRPVPDAPPLALTVARVLHSAGLGPVHLVGRQNFLQELGLPVVPDPHDVGHHPLFGVAAALAHADRQQARSALVVPCDTPDLCREAIAALLEPAGATVATVDGRIQPLFAKLPPAWKTEAMDAARAGWSARRFVDRPEVSRVRLPASVLVDLDTPDDLANWTLRQRRDT